MVGTKTLLLMVNSETMYTKRQRKRDHQNLFLTEAPRPKVGTKTFLAKVDTRTHNTKVGPKAMSKFKHRKLYVLAKIGTKVSESNSFHSICTTSSFWQNA